MISCEREAGVRAQAPLRELFVLCVWCVSAFCDKARHRNRSSWEMTDVPHRHVQLPESFRLYRTLEITHIPAGGLRSGSLGWELETTAKADMMNDSITGQRWKRSVSEDRSDRSRLLKEIIVLVGLRAVHQTALFWQLNALDDESESPRVFISVSESTANTLTAVLLLPVMSSGWLPAVAHIMMNE